MSTYPRKLDRNRKDEWGWTSNDWIAHPDCESAGGPEKTLIDNRPLITVWGEVSDADACYSFDEYALVQLKDEFYFLNTSGCSCPSPTETWGVVAGGLNWAAMREFYAAWITNQIRCDYGMGSKQRAEFDEMFARVEKARAEGTGL